MKSKGTIESAVQGTSRRDFLKTAGAGGAFLLMPSGTLFGAEAPSNKLNIALIGAHGRGAAHYDGIAKENVVALCDVDENHLALAAERFPKAKHYVDWRKCLEQKDLDAVLICTCDHTHAFITQWAMNRGLHVYCEKPLANSVEEARLVHATYMKNKDKLATQVGTQRHAHENFNRVREFIKDGAIGELKEAHAWGNRQLRKDGYPPGKGTPPENLHYDLWIGPSPMHPYNPEYFSGDPGMNCLNWNMYWDFGTGQVGDMGSHTMDIVWNALDADRPAWARAEGEPFNPEVSPVELHTTFQIPENDWRPGLRVHWHQGGAMPNSPREYVDLSKIGHGALFRGTKGYLVSHFDTCLVIPNNDMAHYAPRPESELIPAMGNFQQEWIDACKGDRKTSCDFDYAGKMIEMMLLGLVAYRAGEKLDYDGATGKVSHGAEDDPLYRRTYRDGWVLDG
ncbi:MAG: Gfo/Idh/MocA family oxidoreductase [Candidatus Hydrogenedentota bacterium]